jgi:lipid-binding SYLF domain-containing protein
MNVSRFYFLAILLLITGFSGSAWADDYADTVKIFKEAGESSEFFDKSYGYAIFPTIGKGGVGIGGAYGKGRVYAKGAYVGDTSMVQVTVGFQFGGQGYSQIVFFEDQRAFKEFTSGDFEFGAQAAAVAITAGASASANTAGSSTSASGGKNNATTQGSFNKGMATFTVAKGGLMYEASIGGQHFSYTPRKKKED